MNKKQLIGIIMGGFSAERHISVESGRNVYEKLASSGRYTPIPIFLTGSSLEHRLYILPLQMLLKDSADDIHQKLSALSEPVHTHNLSSAEQSIVKKYVGTTLQYPKSITYQKLASLVEYVFIALHGRPGEDGTLQDILEKHHLPYNGSGAVASKRTIDKFNTNRFLYEHGIKVANQQVVYLNHWQTDQEGLVRLIEKNFKYPFIAKPVDDGCSIAVVKIKSRSMLIAYAEGIFRKDITLPEGLLQALGLKPQAGFPRYGRFLVEDLVDKGNADHFLEITGGLLTRCDAQGQRIYEMFEPSEVVATHDILSMEEKFLAGEGQNITPARFHVAPTENTLIAARVKADLQKAAKLLAIEEYARIDAMVKIYPDHVETWILEVNTLPALTPATCIFHQCALNGYTPLDFIEAIIQYGQQEHY
jgi:D-alanine--D-alanine ligase